MYDHIYFQVPKAGLDLWHFSVLALQNVDIRIPVMKRNIFESLATYDIKGFISFYKDFNYYFTLLFMQVDLATD